MKPSHHPVEEFLLDYALGHLPEAWALAVATHLTFCPDCRNRVAGYERMAGQAVAEAGPVPMGEGSLAAVLQRLDAPPAMAESPPAARPDAPLSIDGVPLPAPLRRYLAAGEAGRSWRRVMSGLDELRLPVGEEGQKAVLLRIQPGRAMPWHTHRGEEMTVVLDGGFVDASGEFRRGDCALLDSQVDHRPVAMEDRACLCLAVTDAPLKLTGPVGRWLNPLIRY
ncbi:ChrR family anti-sigma-E factor [Marinibaculum pumilum]|uniref:ChrR family anti-sigma-E factor n=1 Tax=Marinibaculum pumilum TaxID=1766165 RepID=A0ABV7KWH3_9PROT